MTITQIIKTLRKTEPVDLITTLDDLVEEYNLTKCEDSVSSAESDATLESVAI